MIIDELDYLEHHGVKGMKWGQRRAANKAAKQEAFKNLTPVQKRQVRAKSARKKALVAGLTTGAAYALVIGGAQYVTSPRGRETLIRKAAEMHTKKAEKQANAGRIFVKDFIDATSRVVDKNNFNPARLMLARGG